MYQVGDVTFYNVYGICKIEGIEEREFHGQTQLYYVLNSTHYPTMKLYHPVDSKNSNLKKVLSKDAALSLMECFTQPAGEWIEHSNTRMQQFKVTLNSNDHVQIAQLLNTLSRKKIQLETEDKKLSPQYLQILQKHSPILCEELAIALHLSKEVVQKKIDTFTRQAV
ncbi:transcriptional regulator [Lysinibacillus sp. 2017]|uniref:CarD family transcriptional regulator n=1 Tax=unclassified Lysinibacillus TaxID=2636778 RepID=UPI000D525FBE|nr:MULTISPECIES: CarD family transcriptional regulator [unclassified Lysinibacillus]AWE08275.1 transcriptional regulator [Lysinibacillus sp. 2017]TGN36222.1 transcriptional regulator [Lysinibacillus sp. S2017]